MRDQTDFKYPLDDIDLLADEFNTSEQKVRTVIANYGLFEVDEKQMFFSTKFNEFMQPYLTMKEQRRLAGIKSGEARREKALLTAESNDRSTDVQRELNGDEQSKVKKRKENVYSETSVEFRLAAYLFKFIQERKTDYTEPNFQEWAKHIDYMIRLDKRDFKEIGKVIEWCQQDEFWQNNILSTSKLRKQYDQLVLKMKKSTPSKPKLNIVQSDLREYNA